jgi:UDP-arabinose 4-epimerase
VRNLWNSGDASGHGKRAAKSHQPVRAIETRLRADPRRCCGSQRAFHSLPAFFNATGADPEGELVERHDPETHLIPLAIGAASGQGLALPLLGTDYATADGTCERDFIHVFDLARAHVAALRALQAGQRSLTLNLGSGRATSVRSVIAAVERVTGRKVPTVVAARRHGDPPVLVAAISAARRAIGFEPRLSDLAVIVETAWRARCQGVR